MLKEYERAIKIRLTATEEQLAKAKREREQICEKMRFYIEAIATNAARTLRLSNRQQMELTRFVELARDHSFRRYDHLKMESMLAAAPLRHSAKLLGALKWIVSWSFYIIPAKRRDEIIGDFRESIHSARKQGAGRLGIKLLFVSKIMLYVWAALRLRFGDLVQPAEDQDVA